MVVHQLVPSFKVGDATGQAALHYQLLIRQLGHFGEIFAEEIGTGLESLVRPARALSSEKADLVLYHHGIASPLAGIFLHLRCRRGIIYHNITPARFYQGTPLFEPLVSGRAQLAALAKYTDLALGDSAFHTAELRQVGYENA